MAEEEAEKQQEERIDPIELFSKEVQRPVEGLLYLGQLTDKFEFAGHNFVLKTLLPQEKFAISLALQPYRNTIHEVDAFQTLNVAMALLEVDGEQDWCPPAQDDITNFARARLNWIARRWYPPTIEYLFSRYVLLEQKAAQAIDELNRLSQGSQPDNNLPPWLGSLIEQGGSDEQIDSGMPLFTPSKSD